MNGKPLQTLDLIVFFTYFIIVSAYGIWIYRSKKAASENSGDYFLAEGSLTWWAIGSSLIASNISAEQFIGMSGNGFSMGLAIASYEWMAAATLILVAIFFLPIYLRNRIFTMPQFLNQRYNGTVATIMAIFWLFLYVFVNLTAILHLGALAVSTISGVNYYYCIYGFAIFAVFITLGGMKVIGYTDVIQVAVLILGGLATTYLALDLVAQKFHLNGVMAGLNMLTKDGPDHFHMILNKGQMMIPDGQGGTKDAYMSLPGLTVLFGGMWIANFNYWGCNQYITQRALGADLHTARSGLLFAAFLKLLMPIIVVLPGIAAYVLYKNGEFQTQMTEGAANIIKPDHAYPVLINLLPVGLKGLSFAALTAAIVASLAGKANSIATIFTLDLYKKMNPTSSEINLVRVGKIVIIIAMIIGCLVAPMLRNLDSAFQFIQKYTGFVSPGIFAIFAMGFFWRRTTGLAALIGAIITIPISYAFDSLFPEIPFLSAMGYEFIILVAIMAIISLLDKSEQDLSNRLHIEPSMFRVSRGFAIGASIVIFAIICIYSYFW